MMLPDGTLYQKQGSAYVIKNDRENRTKIYRVYPEWDTNACDETITMRPFAAREVFK